MRAILTDSIASDFDMSYLAQWAAGGRTIVEGDWACPADYMGPVAYVDGKFIPHPDEARRQKIEAMAREVRLEAVKAQLTDEDEIRVCDELIAVETAKIPKAVPIEEIRNN